MAYERGRYVCEVVAQGFSEAKNEKQTPFFYLTFKPVALLNPSNWDEQFACDNYERDVKLWLSSKAVPFSIARLRGLGWNGNSFRELEPGGGYSFVGQKVELVCDHETNDGNTYDRWDFPFEGNSIQHEESPGLAKKLDSLFGRELKKTASELSQETVPPAEVDDEDIPF